MSYFYLTLCTAYHRLTDLSRKYSIRAERNADIATSEKPLHSRGILIRDMAEVGMRAEPHVLFLCVSPQLPCFFQRRMFRVLSCSGYASHEDRTCESCTLEAFDPAFHAVDST